MPGSLIAVLVVLFVMVGCATSPTSDLPPGQRPDPDSTEANLWMAMDKAEERLKASGLVVRNADLNAYLHEVACRLASDYCAQIRIYVVDVPYFNATMAPNGVLQIWTGMLLRTENEAQLASVMGHELVHYTRRHSLQRWIDLQNKMSGAAVISLLSGAAGVGYVGSFAELAAMASVLAYSRDQEREADSMGSESAIEAGYDPREAVQIWQALRDERTVSENDAPPIFLSTHPGIDERIRTLGAAARAARGTDDLVIGTEHYVAVTRMYQDEWLGDELTRGAYAESEVLLKRLLQKSRAPGLIHFYLGEIHRKRAGAGDSDRAIAEYEAALAEDEGEARAYRGLGQVLIREGNKRRARVALERYLVLNPDAEDRLMIEDQIMRLR